AAAAEGKGLRLEGCAAAVARARSLAAEAALGAGTDAVQVHGGYGFSTEYPAERLFRDARALALLSGGTGGLLRASAEPVLRETPPQGAPPQGAPPQGASPQGAPP
ncbi:MAG: acyl-CoA dehydrogenase family protein, partial [Nitrospinota bacterium]